MQGSEILLLDILRIKALQVLSTLRINVYKEIKLRQAPPDILLIEKSGGLKESKKIIPV
jgi:hypothetical protein